MDPKLLIYIIKEGKKPMYDFSKEQDELWEAIKCFEEHVEDIQSPTSLPDEVDSFIIDKIKDALIECNNNRTHAADRLGIKRETLLAKMRKYLIR